MKESIKIPDNDPLPEVKRLRWSSTQAMEISKAWQKKFLDGMREHGCDLGTVPVLKLLEEMEAEHLDALSYIREIRRRIVT